MCGANPHLLISKSYPTDFKCGKFRVLYVFSRRRTLKINRKHTTRKGSPTAEAMDLKSSQCEFKSHSLHQRIFTFRFLQAIACMRRTNRLFCDCKVENFRSNPLNSYISCGNMTALVLWQQGGLYEIVSGDMCDCVKKIKNVNN